MLDLSIFSRKTNTGIREAALDWYQATTLADRKRLFDQNGVRYSPLLELPYLLPISHVVVEPMHNIFLGILRYHGQALMGLKIDKKAMAIDYDNDSESEDEDKLDMNDIQEELDAELEELKIRPDIDLNLEDYHHHLNHTASNGGTQTKKGSDNHEHYDSDKEDDLDYCATGLQHEKDGSSSLSSKQIEDLPLLFTDKHTFNTEDSGQACGGKLKADEWANLFTVILIPVLEKVYTEATNNTKTCLLHNFFHLVSAANSICSPVTNQQHVNSLKMHIQSYRANLHQLFPQMHSRPNHHMALHIPEAMARFGPASVWTMWVHERTNGVLCMIPNNHQICKHFLNAETHYTATNYILSQMYFTGALDLTLLRRFVTSANLNSQLPKFSEKLPEPLKTSIFDFLGPTNANGSHHDYSDNPKWPPASQKLVHLGQRVCAKLISRLQKVEKLSIHIGNSGVQANKVVIPPLVLPMNSFKYQGRDYSAMVLPSIVSYKPTVPVAKSYGSIRQIFTIAYGERSSRVRETWLEVQPFRELTDLDKPPNPYAGWPNVKTKLAYMHKAGDTDCASRDSASWHIIKCSKIISHSSLYVAPGGSFSIQQATAILTELANHTRYSYPKI
ncbi:uncharacterized protein MELLADRAFT_110079 [Melampsora larici-populina 98AG31]|uniref:Uncharacterized protein n=1 Tax=Melampsora larici-populina (strain 98AG31 / pathotype 3-4-7) TaxID=747676 RepID=F4RYL0_MELLP|nr:uncharacterized protein MELLADRAFT_110079 [Melampsora larici-populina 98AG31]EGG02561.1 hypothetical protein MELLADRAFT_110079 [Melampsora larici-populina 98AG31]